MRCARGFEEGGEDTCAREDSEKVDLPCRLTVLGCARWDWRLIDDGREIERKVSCQRLEEEVEEEEGGGRMVRVERECACSFGLI
jgi:hypothetical protein